MALIPDRLEEPVERKRKEEISESVQLGSLTGPLVLKELVKRWHPCERRLSVM